jgi:uncharacterized membrane protein YkvI
MYDTQDIMQSFLKYVVFTVLSLFLSSQICTENFFVCVCMLMSVSTEQQQQHFDFYALMWNQANYNFWSLFVWEFFMQKLWLTMSCHSTGS